MYPTSIAPQVQVLLYAAIWRGWWGNYSVHSGGSYVISWVHVNMHTCLVSILPLYQMLEVCDAGETAT